MDLRRQARLHTESSAVEKGSLVVLFRSIELRRIESAEIVREKVVMLGQAGEPRGVPCGTSIGRVWSVLRLVSDTSESGTVKD